MRFLRGILLSVMFLAVLSVSAKGSRKQTVYMFGFSASFNDSIVYFTPIEEVQAYIANDRTHFLVAREQYSYQLRNYFENRGQLHRTCVTIYDVDRKKIEKKFQSLKEKYTVKSKKDFDVVTLAESDFKFETVSPEEGTVYVDSQTAEEEAKKPRKHRGPKGPKPDGDMNGRPDKPMTDAGK